MYFGKKVCGGIKITYLKYFNFITGDGMNVYMAYRVTTKVASATNIFAITLYHSWVNVSVSHN